MTIVKLNYIKAKKENWLIDYKEFMNKYSVVNKSVTIRQEDIIQPYKMMLGTPKLINIEGSYISVDNLFELALNNKNLVSKYISTLKSAADDKEYCYIEFKWDRDSNGRVR